MRYLSTRWALTTLAIAGTLMGTHLVAEEVNYAGYYANSGSNQADSPTAELPTAKQVSHNEPSCVAPACGCTTAAACDCQPCQMNPTCCQCNQSCCGHWIGGAEAVFLSPQYNSPGRVAVFNEFTFANTTDVFTDSGTEIDQLTAAPRVWLGYQGEQNGFQVRYFKLDADETFSQPFNPVSFTTYQATNTLELETFDLEFTRLFCFHGHQNQFTFGARYAHLELGSSVTGTSLFASELLSGSAFSGFQFEGVGLTTSLNGKRQIGCSNCSWFYNARASFLWDDQGGARVGTQAFQTGQINTAFRVDQGVAQGNTDLFIGEIQLGLQYDRALKCIPANAFIRGAFEYQYWDTTGAGSLLTISRAELVGVESSTAFASSGGDAILDLVGFSIGAGITW